MEGEGGEGEFNAESGNPEGDPGLGGFGGLGQSGTEGAFDVNMGNATASGIDTEAALNVTGTDQNAVSDYGQGIGSDQNAIAASIAGGTATAYDGGAVGGGVVSDSNAGTASYGGQVADGVVGGVSTGPNGAGFASANAGIGMGYGGGYGGLGALTGIAQAAGILGGTGGYDTEFAGQGPAGYGGSQVAEIMGNTSNAGGKGDFLGGPTVSTVDGSALSPMDMAALSQGSLAGGRDAIAGVGTSSSTVAGGNNPAAQSPAEVAHSAPATEVASSAPAHGGATVGQAAASGGGMALGFGAENANYGGALSGIGSSGGNTNSAETNGFGGFNSGNGVEAPTMAQLDTAYDLSQVAKNDSPNPVTQAVLGPWAAFSPFKDNPFWTFG